MGKSFHGIGSRPPAVTIAAPDARVTVGVDVAVGDASCVVCIHRPIEDGGRDSCWLPRELRESRRALAQHDCPRFEFGTRPERVPEQEPQEEALF